jgi:PIN domain nuclease of toxin-antitoxin system
VILLDTHALVWWVAEPDRIPTRSRRLIDAALKSSEALAVSAISVWEIAMLVERGRLRLTIDSDTWIANVESLPFLAFQSVDTVIARRAVHLPAFPHRDPADRMIVATALGLNATLVTADRRLRAYAPLRTSWD